MPGDEGDVEPPPPAYACPNGHPVEAGDLICSVCDADIVEPEGTPPLPAAERIIAGWRVISVLDRTDGVSERLIVSGADGSGQAVLTLYENAQEPDPDVYTTLRQLDLAHVAEVLEFGRYEGCFYEVTEQVPCGHLGGLAVHSSDGAGLQGVVRELGEALNQLAQVGLRHRDLRPETVLVRTTEPLDLVLGGFGSARLSDLDLDVVAPLASSRYMAPEAVVGAVAAASDWWSLGILLLEKATTGACFEGVNDQGFLIHALANGVPLPQDLDPALSQLLRGLLTRDRERRWQWPQVSAWLAGEPQEDPGWDASPPEPEGPSITLGGKSYRSPRHYALAAADAAHWDEALMHLQHGAVALWIEERGGAARQLALLRSLVAKDLEPDTALALALKVLSPDLPLLNRGVILSPGWLLEHPEPGYALIAGDAPAILAELGTEPWVGELRRRADRVRERAKRYEVELVEARLRVLLLSTSGARLRTLWDEQRRLFPDTDHRGLANLIDRPQWGDDDLILLLAADPGQFRPIGEVVGDAAALCESANIPGFEADAARALVSEHTRRELFAQVRERIADFASCDHPTVNEWASRFRIENRTQMARALAILVIPSERWLAPPHQGYLTRLLEFFEQKAMAAIRRGPLARMRVTRTGRNIDLTELGTARQSAETLLDGILARTAHLMSIDPAALMPPLPEDGLVAAEAPTPARAATSPLESRLRNLSRHTALYRRDTGIDGLYLGFPFLLFAPPEEGVKPRIAPLLLWPVRLDAELGRQGQIRIGFDPDREEVRLNPALDGYLGSEAMERWRDAATAALGRDLRTRDLMDELGLLATPQGRELARLPGLDVRVAPGPGELRCSAVLFHMAFTGQALVEDLRQLRGLQGEGSALAPMLRLPQSAPAYLSASQSIPEAERYFTVASDPSQEEAVFAARREPGVLVSGPPGTGKSQTIVNIVGDAIGRRRSVLVVCQKQAALEVVHKRLIKEGLGARIVMVADANKNRREVIGAVRAQIEHGGVAESELSRRRAERELVASRIDELESQIDRRHQALHAPSAQIGRSYRDLVGELVALESSVARPPIAALAVREVLGQQDQSARARVEEQVPALASVWLASDYEASPLQPLKPFAQDASTRDAFLVDFNRFVTAERSRARCWEAHPTFYNLDTPQEARHWLQRHAERLTGLLPDTLADLARWAQTYQLGEGNADSALVRRRALKDLTKRASNLAAQAVDAEVVSTLRSKSQATLVESVDLAEAATRSGGLFAGLNPARWVRRHQLRRVLRDLGLPTGKLAMVALRTAARWELDRREVRDALAALDIALGLETGPHKDADPQEVAQLAQARVARLDGVAPLGAALGECPIGSEVATAAVRAGTLAAISALIQGMRNAVERHSARIPSGQALATLERWMEADWVDAARERVAGGDPDLTELTAMEEALPRLDAFQRFRARAPGLSPDSLATFRALREVAPALETIASDELREEVRRILRREAYLDEKARIEARCPDLLGDRAESDQAIHRLATLDLQIRDMNRQHLSDDIPAEVFGNHRWQDITRLTGPRARRLREFVELGSEIGLMALRPVWLMNPNVASQVLPLKSALFDLVVFDEASQMPVEHSLPSLYRGRLVVVSGDEKQLPPTAFFSSRVESDEAGIDDADGAEGDSTEADVEAAEERWNRREIKDCPDLLALAGAVLRTQMLEVHYRSNFRELIAYSNAAFYAGRLHVPVQHPAERVRAHRPIEVVRVDGLYQDQSNLEEAERIVDLVAGIWADANGNPPTVGVVTFNRKQADLIEDRMETRAEAEPAFRDVYRRELDRREGGEDMGFFVKNLENVQGDERDIMLFSTTFGRNVQGQFRRNFGVLGQRGGERRLNVAITRAKDKIVLATSMPVAEVSDLLGSARAPAHPRDYLQAYLAYAGHLSDGKLDAAASLISRFQVHSGGHGKHGETVRRADPFAEHVGGFIRDALRLDPVAVADGTAFGIHWGIRGADNSAFAIGIECDSPLHRLLDTARAREIWRPAVLSRSMPVVHRVWSAAWYAEPEREQGRLCEAINAAMGTMGEIKA